LQEQAGGGVTPIMLLALELVVALALGFVLGRIWEIRKEMQVF
jgi:hypothetical protein